MKILHTSDWHLGHQLYGYDRSEEHGAMIDQMVEIVSAEKPDVFLLCGDVFDVSQPSAAVQKFMVGSLVRLQQACPDMVMVITAGNHDSGSRHEVFRIPWKVLGVEMIGTLTPEFIDGHIIEIPGKGFVVALPYANERYIPKGFMQKVLDEVESRNAQGLPVVMTAHTTVRGADYSGHDNVVEHVVGGLEGVDLKDMGEGYDYLALGHIHHGQFVHSGSHNVRYSGSPVAVSFDENYTHSVSIVELETHGKAPVVKTVEIRNPRPLVSLPLEGEKEWKEALRLLEDYPPDVSAYIRLNVVSDGFLPPGASEQAFHATKGKECRFCTINHRLRNPGRSDNKALTVQEFKATPPLEIAKRFIEGEGGEFSETMKGLFEEVLLMIEDEDREN